MFGHVISGYIVNHLPQNLNESFVKENVKSFSSKDDFAKVKDILSITFVQTNINLANISQVCQGKRKTAGKYIWKFL